MDFVYITSFDLWKILGVKAFFAAVLGKTGYEKWKVSEHYLIFSLMKYKKEQQKKNTVAGVARKLSNHNIILVLYV